MNTTLERKKTMTDHIAGLKAVTIGGIALGTIAELFESIIGMSPVAYMALIALFVMDFFTGLSAAAHRGDPITSKKMPRIIMKIMVITGILTLVNIFAKEMGGFASLGIQFNFYTWIYYVILHICILSQFYSILENLRDMGINWALNVLNAIDSTAKKLWIFKYIKRKK